MSQILQTSSACLVMLLLVPTTTQAADEHRTGEQETHSQETLNQETLGNQSKPAPLSVAPMDHIDYPADRPQWVSAPPSLGETPHTWVVVSGPSDTVEESANDLLLMQRAAVATYIKGLPGAEGRFDFFPISDEWIDKELVTRRYSGQVIQGGQERYEHAIEIQFDQKDQDKILAALKNVEVRDRLGALGVLVFIGLVGLICSSTFVGMLSRRTQRRDATAVPSA